jgi:hypothetical protein
MSFVLEDLLVAMLVAGSAVFSAWRLMPIRTRLGVLDRLEPMLGGIAEATLHRLRAKALAQLAGGCGACAGGARHLRPVKR